MKRLMILPIVLLYSCALWAQDMGMVEQKTDKRLLPTKYATILYGNGVTAVSGNNKQLAAHWQNTGGGLFTRQKDIQEGGDYEVAISYSTNQPGIVARLSGGDKDTVAAELQVTSGYYPEKKNWYEFNCERRQMPGKLYLQKGKNTILLQLITKSPDQETILYAIELLPVAKKALVKKDRDNASKMHANTNWFAKIPYGVMFHWTSQTMPEHGILKPYNEAVKDFDVGAFVNMVVKTGAGYVILTTNHAEPYFPAPLKEWEKIYPGHTMRRDLVEEIADSLQRHHIKLFLYLATHVYARFDKVNDE